MAGALRVLSSVQSRLLHHAGASSHPQSATGWLVGLPSERGVIVTSILHSDIGFDKDSHLLQDIGKFCLPASCVCTTLPSRLLFAEEASSLLPVGLSIIGTYILLKDTNTADKQATDLCIRSWTALRTHQQVCSICTIYVSQPVGTQLRPYLQKCGVQNSQLYCAVLQPDSVSWFQLLNATTADRVSPSVIEDSSSKQSTAQNVLAQHDSEWLNTAFTKVFCSVAAQLHVYGADSDANRSSRQKLLPPDQLYTPAITTAITAVKDGLCGASTVLLATPPGKGMDPAGHHMTLLPKLCRELQPGDSIIDCRSSASDSKGTQEPSLM